MTEHPLEVRVKDEWPLEKWSELRSVVAVSGGADSIALLRVITKMAPNRGKLIAAHLNHGLRGRESDQDQRFVEDVCRSLAIPCQTERIAPHVITGHKAQIGTESAARQLRYQFLRQTAESLGARYILTAHTADDQAETVLHNICRGTGLAGLAGIPFARPISEAVTVVRPLLNVWRSEILSYLDQISQSYRTDSSNQTSAYTRNRIRNDILPRIEGEINRSARKHLVQLARLARESSDELDRAASRLDVAIIRQTGTELWLDPETLVGSSEFLVVQFLKHCWSVQHWPAGQMDHDRWKTLAAKACGSTNSAEEDLPGGIRFQRSDHEIRFIANGLR